MKDRVLIIEIETSYGIMTGGWKIDRDKPADGRNIAAGNIRQAVFSTSKRKKEKSDENICW